ncbi:FAD-dependent oxidoreductase [Pseudomonas sp. NY15463]|uniref:FAD-dependent oxidoreductase n=1 Tax=Pseudomonas sp. NY15463 TaxID=3400361 RepID=UPI003A88ADB3
MTDIDCLVIGAGVIGLACAAQMARQGNSVMLVEQQCRIGPDVAWTQSLDYRVDKSLCEGFFYAIKRYFPSIDKKKLFPGYSGIRPKFSAPGQPAADFMIQGPEVYGLPGLVNLYGIESPGLTASLAIAQHVSRLSD